MFKCFTYFLNSIKKLWKFLYAGIEGLCGPPLDKPCNSTKMPSIASIIMVSIAVTAALLAIGAGIVILSRRNQSSPCQESPAHKSPSASQVPAVGSRSPDCGSSHGSSGKRAPESAKLSFVRDDLEKFDLSDLLKASAEILGSGCFGSSYKAALSNGPVMVVKRFKQMNNVDREEFQEHMRRIGRLKHANLLPLVAYYYKREEKLLITDFVEKGSLAVQLHGTFTFFFSFHSTLFSLTSAKNTYKKIKYIITYRLTL